MVADGFRLSLQQKHLWLGMPPSGRPDPCRVICAIEILGDLDRGVLARALDMVVLRHEILRTRFVAPPGVVIAAQVIEAEGSIPLQICEAGAQAALAEAARFSFDPSALPLAAAWLVESGAERHTLTLTLSALCADAVSVGVLVRELGLCYQACISGNDREAPAMQYCDFSEWQHELYASEETLAGRELWRRRELSDLSEVRLPGKRRSVGQESPDLRTFAWPMDSALETRLRSLAAACGTAPEIVVLCAWQALLMRLCGRPEILVGVAHDGRKYAELAEVSGPLSRLLPMPLRIEPDQSFSMLMARVAADLEEARAWQECFSWDLQGGNREWDSEPVLPFSFEFQSAPDLWSGGGITLDATWVDACCDRSELGLVLVQTRHGIEGRIRFDPDLYRLDEAERMAERLETVLASVLERPEAPWGVCEVVGDRERRLLADLAQGDRPVGSPGWRLLHEAFLDRVRLVPQALAVRAGDRELTYGELYEQASRLAERLRVLGVGPETVVGLCVERSPEMLVGIVGILLAGGAYLPLDPGYPEERTDFMVEDSGAALVVVPESLRGRLEHLGVPLIDVCPAPMESQGSPPAAMEPEPAHLAYLIYTSGSTGKPKAVAVTHANAVASTAARWTYYRAPVGAYLLLSSFAFDSSVAGIFWTLWQGGTLVLPPEEFQKDLDGLIEQIRRERVTHLLCLPSLYRLLLDQGGRKGLGTLSVAIVAGEASTGELVRRHTEILPETVLFNEYGPTEGSVWCTVHECSPDDLLDVPIGKVIPGARVHLLDPLLRPSPWGADGEVFVGGPGIVRGYSGRPELTAERFVPDPFAEEPGARLYRTGDLARYRPEGHLLFLGRIDHQVKIRGYRIELGEIEAALERFPGVVQAVVLAVDDPGGSGKRLVAYVAAEASENFAGRLRTFLEQLVPEYMVPGTFVRLDALPLTPNGKVDRKALPDWNLARFEAERPYVAPRTEAEGVLVRIWAEVLGIDRVGVHDDFFQLGGDSIRTVQVMTKARSSGLSFTLPQMFAHRTAEELAAVAEPIAVAGSGTLSTPAFAWLEPEDREVLPADAEDAYPLTQLQAGMLFHSEMSGGQGLYIDVLSARLEGSPDVASLRASIAEMVSRHAVLRTSFAPSGYHEPLQVVHRAAAAELKVEDLSFLADEEAELEIASWMRCERLRGFDWRHAPLVRFQVHLRRGGTFQFSLACHHAVLDGWSAATLLTELFEDYLARREGLRSPLLPLPAVRFADFVGLELQAVRSQETRAYWIDWLREASATSLPRWPASHREAPEEPAWITTLRIPEDVLASLQDLAKSGGVPLKSVLLAAHLRVILSLVGRRDAVTGVISNGRPETAESERVLGLFLNTVPFRLRTSGGTWLDLVRETFAAEREWMPHRRFPLAELQKMHGGELFDTAFNFVHFHVYDQVRDLGGPKVLDTRGTEQTNFALVANFALGLDGTRLDLELVGASQALAKRQVAAISGYYLRILKSMGDPMARWDLAELLSPEERRLVLFDWSAPWLGAGGGLLHERFAAQSRQSPDAIALAWAEESLTYRELDSRAAALARHLRTLGVGPEVPVGVCVVRSPEMLVALLGVLRAGGAYVPIDPAYPQERIAQMLNGSSARFLLTERNLLTRLPQHDARVVLLGRDAVLQSSALDPATAALDSENLAYLIFTSGSTGTPKAVGITHRSAAAFIDWAGTAFAPEELDGVLAATSICFDLSIFELFVPLSWGGRIVLVENVLDLPAQIAANEVVLVNTVPSVLSELLETWPLPASVRTVNLAGEALPRKLADRLYGLSTVGRVLNLYGPSEDTTYSTWAEVERRGEEPPPIGRPVLDTRAWVLDESLQPLPVGTPGELYLAGSGQARGYLANPEATASAFVPDAYGSEPGGRMYRTGDLARHLPGGNLEYMGRRDHQVKIRGFRIELGEIEAVLRRQPSVREAAVVARGEAQGSGGRLVAYVVPNDQGVLSDDLLRSLRRSLPAHMVPGTFVVLDRMPLTATGKIDRRALPAETGPDSSRDRKPDEPRTPTEDLLAGIWANVLRIDTIGLGESFFDLGGHSLLALQVISRIRDTFGIDLTLPDLFASSTVEAISTLVDESLRRGAGVATPPLLPADRSRDLPLSYAQERLWFLEQLSPGTAFYNLPQAVRLEGRLDVRALQAALSEVVRRHQILRTVYRIVGGLPRQFVLAATHQPLAVVDLSALAVGRRERMTRSLVDAEARLPFDLERGPVLRTVVLRAGVEDHLLLFTVHHIASDFWSAGILQREVAALYAALATGKTVPPMQPRLQYADFAAWERSWLHGDQLARQLAWWRERLNDAPHLLELPADRRRPTEQSFRGRREPWHLSAELSAQLRALARQQQATLFMVLLAAFQLLVHRLTGRTDIVLGTDVAGRSRLEIEGLIGFFVNQLVLRTDLSGNPTFRQLLGRSREATLAAYAHQEVPFEKVVEAVLPDRDLSYAPIFQVKLVLQNAIDGWPADESSKLRVTPLQVEKGTAQLDLVLNLQETPAGLEGGLEYNLDIFDQDTVAELLHDFGVLLEEVVRQPGLPLDLVGAAVEAARIERRRREEIQLRENLSLRFQRVRSEVVAR